MAFEREKIINTIIFFAKKTQKCYKMKLMKLFYFSDFEHYRQTGKSISGLDYSAWKKGPVPVDLYNELDSPKEDLDQAAAIYEDEFTNGWTYLKISPKKEFNPKYFSARELNILKETAEMFEEAKADDMSEASHFPGLPWGKTPLHKTIDYNLVLSNREGGISPERLKEKQELNAEMEKFLANL